MSGYSVFIPRMFSNIKENRIRKIFHEQNIGNVKHVDLISKTNGKGDTYNMAFVHFDIMYNTDSSVTFRQDVENPDTKTKFKYDEPWFWLVLPFVQKEQNTNHQQVNPCGSDFVTFANNDIYMPRGQLEVPNSGMVPLWVMTPQGPIIQWDFPQYMPCDIRPVITNNNSKTNILKNTLNMVPRQVAYGKHYDIQRKTQRKRLNISTESRKETYAEENGAVFGVGIDMSLEAEMEQQNDYYNQQDMYHAMDKIANKKE